jgi:hypothetical protein
MGKRDLIDTVVHAPNDQYNILVQQDLTTGTVTVGLGGTKLDGETLAAVLDRCQAHVDAKHAVRYREVFLVNMNSHDGTLTAEPWLVAYRDNRVILSRAGVYNPLDQTITPQTGVLTQCRGVADHVIVVPNTQIGRQWIECMRGVIARHVAAIRQQETRLREALEEARQRRGSCLTLDESFMQQYLDAESARCVAGSQSLEIVRDAGKSSPRKPGPAAAAKKATGKKS